MKTKLLFLLFCFLFAFNSQAQDEAKLKKAVKTFNEGDQEKGIKLLEKLIKKDNLEVYWDLLVQMEHEHYLTQKQENQALATLLEETLQTVAKEMEGKGLQVSISSPAEAAFQHFVAVCIDGTRLSNSVYASQYLRNYLVDYTPDTAISEEAQAIFFEAEKAFGAKRFKKAVDYYSKALRKEPIYYKALLYLGDSYWYLEEIDSAIYFFDQGAKLCPNLLEPQKYLTDAFAYKGDYQTAAKKCWNAIYIYPDLSMFNKLEGILEKMDQSFDRHWIMRPINANRFGLEQSDKVKDKVWAKYRAAKELIKPYADATGLITKENSMTKSAYLEVFAWEQMLAADLSKHPELAFAKQMQEEGYLDCYVFISLFQHGFYEQYKHFVQHNPTKIKAYIERYLIQ